MQLRAGRFSKNNIVQLNYKRRFKYFGLSLQNSHWPVIFRSVMTTFFYTGTSFATLLVIVCTPPCEIYMYTTHKT